MADARTHALSSPRSPKQRVAVLAPSITESSDLSWRDYKLMDVDSSPTEARPKTRAPRLRQASPSPSPSPSLDRRVARRAQFSAFSSSESDEENVNEHDGDSETDADTMLEQLVASLSALRLRAERTATSLASRDYTMTSLSEGTPRHSGATTPATTPSQKRVTSTERHARVSISPTANALATAERHRREELTLLRVERASELSRELGAMDADKRREREAQRLEEEQRRQREQRAIAELRLAEQKKAEKEAQAHIAEGLLVTQRAQEVLNAIKAEKKRQEEEVRRKREEEQRLAEEARRKAEEARRAEEEAALRARQEREAAAAKEKAEAEAEAARRAAVAATTPSEPASRQEPAPRSPDARTSVSAAPSPKSATNVQAAPPEPAPAVDPNMGTTAAVADYLYYTRLIEEYHEVAAQMTQGPYENVRAQIAKTVKVSFNTLSAVFSSIMDKVSTLQDVLQQCKRDQLAYKFCLREIADFLTKQAQMQIARKPETAYPYACVALRVALSEPPLLDAIIAHLVYACPYAVPVYPQQAPGESTNAYKLNALRYKPSSEEGVLEKEEAYTSRMKGIISLLAVLYSFPIGHNEFDHKRLALGWTWMARILNTRPVLITAELLCAFIEQSGYYMFLPILSSEGASAYASKTRLKTVVEKALERNFNLEMPKGAQIEQRNDFES